MRTLNWMILAVLVLTLAAAAQQAAPAPGTQQPATTTQPEPTAAPAAPAAQAAPVTMDQVVDRFIEREKGLIKMLSARTPVVETYLQNLTQDTQLGPVPKDDRYFLGRMDLSDSIDRSDYLKDKDEGMEKRLLGGSVPRHCREVGCADGVA